MAKFGKGGLGMKFGGGDPTVAKMAKGKTIGKISGDTIGAKRMDKPCRASGGSVMAPAAGFAAGGRVSNRGGANSENDRLPLPEKTPCTSAISCTAALL